MILVARNVVIDLVRRGESLSESKAVKAGRSMPGYRRYEQAIRAQVEEQNTDVAPAGMAENAD